MSRFIDTAKTLIERFRTGAVVMQPAGLDVLRRVLSEEEFQIVTTALQVEADRLQATEMVDSLVSTRRHDDRTNLIEEIAFKGGWRRESGRPPSEMFLNYMVIITNPDTSVDASGKAKVSLDDQRNVSKGIPIQAKKADGTVVDVYTPRDEKGRPLLVSDKTLHEPVDFVQYLREEDATRAELKLHYNADEKRYEWPVVKCRLKPHFMMACMVLSFDKLANLAWQGAYRRGALTKQDAEKMYANLNWIGPVRRDNLAGFYVMMMHSGIGPVATWPQWKGLTLGGKTVHERNRRFHTYGKYPVGDQSPQWAILNWIVDHGIKDWFSVTDPKVQTDDGLETWESTQLLEYAKDDLVYMGYDHADDARLEDLRRDIEEGDVSVKDGDDLVKMGGKQQLYGHRPDEIRNTVVRKVHIAVSEATRAEIQKEFDRESITRSDVVKFYNSDHGAFHRILAMQDEWRTRDLDLMDEIESRWFMHPSLGMAAIGVATRAKANDMIEKGFGKHRKELSLWGNRISWMKLLRFADKQEQKFLYDCLQSAAGGRILDVGTVKQILRWYGRGYDPHPDCTGHWGEDEESNQVWVFHYRGDGHRHSNNHICEARKRYKQGRDWIEESLEHWMSRVYAQRICEAVLAGWLNMVYDTKMFVARYFDLYPLKLSSDEKIEKRKEMVLQGKGSPFFWFDHAELKPYKDPLSKDQAVIQTEFGYVADILLDTIEDEQIGITEEAAADVWYDMVIFMFGQYIQNKVGDGGQIKDVTNSREDEYKGYTSSRYGQYLGLYEKPF